MLEAIEAIGSQLTQKFDSYFEILAEARASRLGQYTTEQEADELAAEWLDFIGLDPIAASDAFIFLGLTREGGKDDYIIGGKKCKEMRDNDWKDDNGDDIFVPIGDYSEVHHSTCYRAFNASREITAHDYQTTSDSIQAPGITWEDIREQARQATEELKLAEEKEKENAKTAELSKFLGKHDPAKTCVYSAK
jgi:hypothetical protein